MRLLLVEDSSALVTSLRAGLRRLGHAVDVATDGRNGLAYARTNPFDVIVLDLMLPRLDGGELLRTLRRGGSKTRVLVLSAKDTVESRITLLRDGADDYLVKPFSFDELVARIEALHRRPAALEETVVRIGAVEIDSRERTIRCGRARLELSAREFELIRLLASRPGKVVTRFEIEDRLYDESTFPSSNAVEAMVSRLRSHLEVAGAPPILKTRRGVGYFFDPEST